MRRAALMGAIIALVADLVAGLQGSDTVLPECGYGPVGGAGGGLDHPEPEPGALALRTLRGCLKSYGRLHE